MRKRKREREREKLINNKYLYALADIDVHSRLSRGEATVNNVRN